MTAFNRNNPKNYIDSFKVETQTDMEDAIASYISEYQFELTDGSQLSAVFSEENTKVIGRNILLMVLKEFRPDLFES